MRQTAPTTSAISWRAGDQASQVQGLRREPCFERPGEVGDAGGHIRAGPGGQHGPRVRCWCAGYPGRRCSGLLRFPKRMANCRLKAWPRAACWGQSARHGPRASFLRPRCECSSVQYDLLSHPMAGSATRRTADCASRASPGSCQDRDRPLRRARTGRRLVPCCRQGSWPPAGLTSSRLSPDCK